MFPLSHMLKSFIKRGQLSVIDHAGTRHLFGGTVPGPNVTMRVADPSLYYKLFISPELHMGEAYMDGRVTFEGSELRDFLTLFSLNRYDLGKYASQQAMGGIAKGFKRLQQANAIGQARKNVSHHYDLGNDFFKLFLDEGLFYSCAYFRSEADTLEQAQVNKCRLIAAKLGLKPGQQVLDIGCGWGGLAIYLAKIEDVHVTGVTLSKEQHELGLARVKAAGLEGRVLLRLQDYREIEERFDRIVSVGMFEHVGVRHYGEFFGKINDLMRDDGVMLLHSIGKMSPPGNASPWLRKYIFPGAYSPALSEVFPHVERNQLWVTDLEFLRVHYGITLKHWHERFERHRDEIKAMYDERFCRMWEFYLISCEMMFRSGSQEVFHMQLSRLRDASPITRDYMVETQRRYEARERECAGSAAFRV
jgi:cyclopropane-fatty-acyl-phospholipid synthase